MAVASSIITSATDSVTEEVSSPLPSTDKVDKLWCKKHDTELTKEHLKEDHYDALLNYFTEEATDYLSEDYRDGQVLDDVASEYLNFSDENDDEFTGDNP